MEITPTAQPASAPEAVGTPESSGQPNVSDNGSEAAEAGSGTPDADIPEYKRIKHKLPSGDELDYDDLIKKAEKARGADNKFREVAAKEREYMAKEKQVEEIFQHMQSDDPQALKKFLKSSANPKALMAAVEEIVWDQIQEENKYKDQNPEIAERLREADNLKKEKEKWDAQQKEREEGEQKTKRQQEVDQWSQNYDKVIGDAIESSNDLPKNPQTVARMAQYISVCLENEIPFDPKEMVDHVRDSYKSEFASVLQGMTPEQVAKLFGPEALKLVKEFEMGKIKDPRQRLNNSSEMPTSNKPTKYLTPNEFREQAFKRAGI